MNERPNTGPFPIDTRAVESKSAAGDPTPTAVRRGRPAGVEVLPRPFGRYELRRLLGRGGMGAVYLAHDPHLDRLVALKVPTPVALEGWRERFVAEARAAATLTHPNVCPVYDVGEVDGQPFLTMGYIEGETLAARLARERLDPDEAVELVATVARAMQAAHTRGVVHRDLKPANLMLDPAGRPIVMDFGLALRSTATDDLRLTLTGVAMGTPAYMPPEQAGGDTDAIGPPADVYALGVMLYELMTGRVPFKAKSFGQLLAQIERDAPPPPSSFNETVEPALEAIVLTCLAKRPADRFATAGELADALDRFLDGDDRALMAEYSRPFEVPGPTGEFVPAASGSAAVPRQSRRGLWAAFAAVLLLAGAVAGAVIYVQTDYGELEIRLSDPDARVDVRVNGKEVELKTEGDGRVTRIKAGKNQKLEVSGPDYETVAESFDLKRGGVTIVQVRLKPSEAAKKPDPKPIEPNTGKKPPGPDPPVPAVPEKPKPVTFPKESTLIEVPGWQILTDASKEEMQKWLDARKKDKHSVTWLDAIQVGDKRVFCAVAALDERETNWRAFLDTECPSGEGLNVTLGRLFNVRSYWPVTLSCFKKNRTSYVTTLWWPGAKAIVFGNEIDPVQLDEALRANVKNGLTLRFLRPYLVDQGIVEYALRIERTLDQASAHAAEMTADNLTTYLEEGRRKGHRPLSLAAVPQDGKLLFTAVTAEDPGKAAWEVDTDATARTLQARTKTQLARGFIPTIVTAYPWDGAVRYCAVWVKDPPKPVPYPKEPTLIEAAGWQILADASKDEMQKWLDARKKAKHSVMWLDAFSVEGKTAYAAVAATDERAADWVAVLDAPADDFTTLEGVQKWVDQNRYQPLSAVGFLRDGESRMAVLGERGVSTWVIRVGLPTAILPEFMKTITEKGIELRQFRVSPGVNGKESCTVGSGPASARQTVQEAGLTRETLQVQLQAAREKGRRAAAVSACPSEGAPYFAVLTAKNTDKIDWDVSTDLTAAALKPEADRRGKLGYRAGTITAYAWDGAVRYCVVWVKEPAKKP